MIGLNYKLIENDDELKEALAIRENVFIEEQGISEALDRDGEDSRSLHVLVQNGDSAIGTARIRFLADRQAKLERMAILKQSRGIGIGRGIVSFLERESKKRGVKRIELHAQSPVIGFYKKCGFEETGLPFLEADIQHIRMEKDIS